MICHTVSLTSLHWFVMLSRCIILPFNSLQVEGFDSIVYMLDESAKKKAYERKMGCLIL